MARRFTANDARNGTLQELLPDVFLQMMQEMALCRNYGQMIFFQITLEVATCRKQPM